MSKGMKGSGSTICNHEKKVQQHGIVGDEQSSIFLTSNHTGPSSYEPEDNLAEKIPDQYNMMVQ